MVAGWALPGTLDGTIGRVTGMQDHGDGTILESYNYLGADTIVQKNRSQPGVDLSYIQQNGDTLYGGDGGDRYTGLDRFGRVIDQYWVNPNTPGSPTDRFQYGYDRSSNVLYRANLVSTTFSELYHANSSSSGDNNTAYDNLDRITAFRRGTLSASGNNGTSGLDTVTTLNPLTGSNKSYTLDALGNQTQGGRTFNAQDQIAGETYDNDGQHDVQWDRYFHLRCLEPDEDGLGHGAERDVQLRCQRPPAGHDAQPLLRHADRQLLLEGLAGSRR